MDKKKIIVAIEAVVAVFILLALVVLFLPKQIVVAPVVKEVLDIEIFSPKSNELVLSPLKITGIVRGNGWTGFEGQVGTVTLLDANGNQLAQTFLKSTTEWTQLPTNFQADLMFSTPSTNTGSLVFHNENASGEAARDKTFTLPITFK